MYGSHINYKGIKCPELKISKTISIDNSKIIEYEKGYKLRINEVISAKIFEAKLAVEELKAEKIRRRKIKAYLQELTQLIKRMKKIEDLFDSDDEDMSALEVMDTKSDIRLEARKSFETQYKFTDAGLKKLRPIHSIRKTIKQNCLKQVSKILKNHGIVAHKNNAHILLNDNGLDIPTYY